MPLPDTTQIPQPVGSTATLPSRLPPPPDKLVKAFPDFASYHAKQDDVYRRIREAIRNTTEDLALPINKLKQDAQKFASQDDLTAEISDEATARVDGDTALATSISTVSATVDSNYLTLTAAITAEATARATKDGYVESTYTLTATAGHVTTGMRLISASGVTDVSEVVFQADRFRIYNGTSSVPAFDLVGSNLTLHGSITLANTQVSGLGALATQNSVAYGSITGTKPPANADVTLSAIQGSLTLAGGGLVLASGGAAIRGGQTAYNTGNGFWLGDDGGTTKFSLGDSSGNRLTWNGSSLDIAGTVNATSGQIGGFSLSLTSLSSASGSVATLIDAWDGIEIRRNTFASFVGFRIYNGLLDAYPHIGIATDGTIYWGDGTSYDTNLSRSGVGALTLSGSLTATSFSGSGASLTSLNAGNISSGTLSSARMPSSFGGTFTGSISSTYFSTTGTSADVPSGNLRVMRSGSPVVVLNGDLPGLVINGAQVVGPRGSRGSAGLTEVVALLDAWGAWS